MANMLVDMQLKIITYGKDKFQNGCKSAYTFYGPYNPKFTPSSWIFYVSKLSMWKIANDFNRI